MAGEGAQRGPIALVGSGEYLPVMEPIDQTLLQQVGGSKARVVILATAAGHEEPESPRRWTRMGLEHFGRLGATVEAAEILQPRDAHDPRWLPILEQADFFYFSGGSPTHVVRTLSGSPAWEVIVRRHASGAVLAGCSAGAMAFGGYTAGPRALRAMATATVVGNRSSNAESWTPALGLLPHLVVLPHFDRMIGMIGRHLLARAARALPPGHLLLGIDEDTALVQLSAPATAEPARWQVMGRQSVTLFNGDGETIAVYATGEEVIFTE